MTSNAVYQAVHRDLHDFTDGMSIGERRNALKAFLAASAGLLAHDIGNEHASQTCRRIGERLLAPGSA